MIFVDMLYPNLRLSLYVSALHYSKVNDSAESICVVPEVLCA